MFSSPSAAKVDSSLNRNSTRHQSMASSLHSVLFPATRPDSAKHHGLIFLIPGNPGLIDYYIPFIHILRSLLDRSQQTVAVDIFGKSLAGFHDDGHEPFANER